MRSLPVLLLGVLLGALLGLGAGWFLFASSDSVPPQDERAAQRAPNEDLADRALPRTPAGPVEELHSAQNEREAVPVAAPTSDPQLGVLVYGTASARDGSPIEKCSVHFTRLDDTKDHRSTEVAEGHGYAITGLRPGRFKLYSKPTGFVAIEREVEIGEEPSQRLDLVFDRSTMLTVRLVDPSGKPFPEAVAESGSGLEASAVKIVASRDPFSGNLPMTELSGYSRYGISAWRSRSGLDPAVAAEPDVFGAVELAVPPPVHVAALFRHVLLATEFVPAGQSEVVLVVSPDTLRDAHARISLRVLDGVHGGPLSGARVRFSDSQSGGSATATDSDGRIARERAPVGILQLEILADGFEDYEELVRVDPGSCDLGTIELRAPRELAVTVRDVSGRAHGRAAVRWQNLDRIRFPQPSTDRRSAGTDAEGKVTLRGLGEGRYLVQAFDDDGGLASAVVDTRVQSELALRLEATYRVEVPATGEPWSVVHCLTFRDADGLPVLARFLTGFPVQVSLPAGKYTWERHDGTQLVERGAFPLGAAGPTPVVGGK